MPKIVNVRLANKVIWALEDVTSHLFSVDDLLDRAIQHADSRQDIILKLILYKLKTHMAEIKTLLTAARHGEYAGGRIIQENDDSN